MSIPDHRTALVTGAGRGIGNAIARRLAAEGIRVGLVSRTRTDLEATASEIGKEGGEAHVLVCDVSDQAQVDVAVQELLNKWGRIDILVNNAGVGTRAPTAIADYDPEEWDRIMETNFRGVFLVTRAVLPHMREHRSGTIINIGSIAGLRAAPSVGPYVASKFALSGFSQTLVAENTAFGIRVHCIQPGVVNSSIWDRKEQPPGQAVRERMIPADDLASVVSFLLSLPPTIRIDELVVLPNRYPVDLWDVKPLQQDG